MELTPIFRIEKFLDAIINSTTPPEPMFRVEYFLAKIGGADVVTPEPMFRIEKYLAKILGEDVEIPEPMFRTEFWLAKKCGEDVETPDPAFRVEYWLEEWCGGSAPTYETITGKIVSFLTQRIAPLKIEADLEPIQDGSGDPSPDNVRPITGHEGAVVTDTGANIWGGEKMADDMVAAVNDASGCAKGSDTDGNYVFLNASNAINGVEVFNTFKENTQYTIILKVKKNNTNKSLNLRINYTNGTFENVALVDTPTADTVYTSVVTTTNGKSVQNIALMWGSGIAYLYYDNCGVFEGVLTADQFEPYSGSSVTLTFGSTVYGGKLTVNEDGSGKVVSEYGEQDLGDLSWTYTTDDSYAGSPYFASGNVTGKLAGSNDMICERYGVAVNRGSIQNGKIAPWNSTNALSLACRDDAYTDATTFKTAVTGTKLVFKLAAPITITLSPGQVNALLGNNTVWVDDATSVTVTYQSN